MPVLLSPVRRLADGALAAVDVQLVESTEPHDTSHRTIARCASTDVLTDRSELAAISQKIPILALRDVMSSDARSSIKSVAVSVIPEDVLRQPQRTIARIEAARSRGELICLDGLGANEFATTLLALIEPDLIVLGSEAISTSTPPLNRAQLVHAISAYVERSHAVVVAEGVDTSDMQDTAIAMGATFGMGDLFPSVDDPLPLIGEKIVALPERPVFTTPRADASTPYAIARQKLEPRISTKRLLVEMSKHLEGEAVHTGPTVLVLGTFQVVRHFTATTARRWRELADTTGFAGVYGVDMDNSSSSPLQSASLDLDDPLVQEWNVIVLGPNYAAMLTARDLHDDSPDMERRFEVIHTYDHLTVNQAARSVISRFPA